MYKKIFSFILCLALSLSFLSTGASAENLIQASASDKEGIVKSLRMIEADKANYNLSDKDFENLKIADPIKTYEYTDTGISFLGNYVPLICDNVLTAWAMEIEIENEILYQISTAYIDEINEVIDNATHFALIYDKTSCYLYDGAYLHKLGNFKAIAEERLNLTEAALNTSTIELNSLNTTYDLGYTYEAVPYGVVLPVETYRCNVNYVNQLGYGYSSLCWAATIACIVNYTKGTNFTALTMAQANMSADELNKDEGLTKGYEEGILRKYGLSYTYRAASVPSISVIANNINNNMPLFSSFKHSRGRHACTIYGCSINNQDGAYNCIYVMDPEFGSATAYYSSGTYKYVSGYSGVDLTLDYTTRRY